MYISRDQRVKWRGPTFGDNSQIIPYFYFEGFPKEESAASLRLRAERTEIKVEKQEESVAHTVKEEKEETEFCPSGGVSAGGSTFPFTPRNFQAEANLPSFQPPSHAPVLTPYLFTSPFFPSSQTPQFALMPAVNWVVCGACHTMGTIIPFC